MFFGRRFLLLRLRADRFHFYVVRFRDAFFFGRSFFRFRNGLLFLGRLVGFVGLLLRRRKFRRRDLLHLNRRGIGIGLFFFRNDFVLLFFRSIRLDYGLIGRRCFNSGRFLDLDRCQIIFRRNCFFLGRRGLLGFRHGRFRLRALRLRDGVCRWRGFLGRLRLGVHDRFGS